MPRNRKTWVCTGNPLSLVITGPESPVETQSLLIEAFNEIGPDLKLTDQMKYWLLRQKQTRHWSNTKATADACYALLLNGSNWLGARKMRISVWEIIQFIQPMKKRKPEPVI